MPDVAADALLAEPVIDRRVNVVDPGIEHCVEDRFGLGFTDVAGARRAAQLHRAVAEHRYLQTGAPEFALWQFGHRTSFPTLPPSTRARARAREAIGNQRPWPAEKVERWSNDRLIPYAKNGRAHTDA